MEEDIQKMVDEIMGRDIHKVIPPNIYLIIMTGFLIGVFLGKISITNDAGRIVMHLKKVPDNIINDMTAYFTDATENFNNKNSTDQVEFKITPNELRLMWYSEYMKEDYLEWNRDLLSKFVEYASKNLVEKPGYYYLNEFIDYHMADVVMGCAMPSMKFKYVVTQIAAILTGNGSSGSGGADPKIPPINPNDVDLRDPSPPQGLDLEDKPLVYRNANLTRFLLEE